MKRYLLGICFLASIGTICFDAYCMSIPDTAKDEENITFNFEYSNKDKDIYKQIAEYMERAGYFGYKGIQENENIPYENSYEYEGNYYIDRVYTRIPRRGFIWNNNRMMYECQDNVANVPCVNKDPYGCGKLHLIAKILQTFNLGQFTQEGLPPASYNNSENDYITYRLQKDIDLDNINIPCEVCISVSKEKIQNDKYKNKIQKIYVDFPDTQQAIQPPTTTPPRRNNRVINDAPSFLDVKRKLWGNHDEAKKYLKDIIMNYKLLSDRYNNGIVDHIVNHGHIGKRLKDCIINDPVYFPPVMTKSGKLIKLNTSDRRYQSLTVPRSRFIIKNKTIYDSIGAMKEDARTLLQKINSIISEGKFDIESCTHGERDSLEIIVCFNEDINDVKVAYSGNEGENDCKHVCFYLKYVDGIFSIPSIFPVKDKQCLWNNEIPVKAGKYSFPNLFKFNKADNKKITILNDAKLVMRALNYGTNGGIEYFKHIIDNSTDDPTIFKDCKQIQDITFSTSKTKLKPFNRELLTKDIQSINCTTYNSIEDLDIEVKYNDGTTNFLRCLFVKKYKNVEAHIKINEIYLGKTKEDVWESE